MAARASRTLLPAWADFGGLLTGLQLVTRVLVMADPLFRWWTARSGTTRK